MNLPVPFLDMKSPYLEIQEEMDAAYRRVMLSGWYILGEEVDAFEQEFAVILVQNTACRWATAWKHASHPAGIRHWPG